MATTAAIIKRADQFLNAIHSFVDDLPDLIEEWEALKESDKTSTSLDWDHMMGDYLVELEEYCNAGQPSSRAIVSFCVSRKN